MPEESRHLTAPAFAGERAEKRRSPKLPPRARRDHFGRPGEFERLRLTFPVTLASAQFRFKRLGDTKSKLLAAPCARTPLARHLGELVVVNFLRFRIHLLGASSRIIALRPLFAASSRSAYVTSMIILVSFDAIQIAC